MDLFGDDDEAEKLIGSTVTSSVTQVVPLHFSSCAQPGNEVYPHRRYNNITGFQGNSLNYHVGHTSNSQGAQWRPLPNSSGSYENTMKANPQIRIPYISSSSRPNDGSGYAHTYRESEFGASDHNVSIRQPGTSDSFSPPLQQHQYQTQPSPLQRSRTSIQQPSQKPSSVQPPMSRGKTPSFSQKSQMPVFKPPSSPRQAAVETMKKSRALHPTPLHQPLLMQQQQQHQSLYASSQQQQPPPRIMQPNNIKPKSATVSAANTVHGSDSRITESKNTLHSDVRSMDAHDHHQPTVAIQSNNKKEALPIPDRLRPVLIQTRIFWYFFHYYMCSVEPQNRTALSSISDEQIQGADTSEKKTALVEAFIRALGKQLFSKSYYRFDKDCSSLFLNVLKSENDSIFVAVYNFLREKGKQVFTLPLLESYTRSIANNDALLKKVTSQLWEKVKVCIKQKKGFRQDNQLESLKATAFRPQADAETMDKRNISIVISETKTQDGRSSKVHKTPAKKMAEQAPEEKIKRKQQKVSLKQQKKKEVKLCQDVNKVSSPHRENLIDRSAMKGVTKIPSGAPCLDKMVSVLTTERVICCATNSIRKVQSFCDGLRIKTDHGEVHDITLDTKCVSYISEALSSLLQSTLLELLGLCHHRSEGMEKRMLEQVDGAMSNTTNNERGVMGEMAISNAFRPRLRKRVRLKDIIDQGQRKEDIKSELRMKELELEMLFGAIEEKSNNFFESKNSSRDINGVFFVNSKRMDSSDAPKKRMLYSEWKRNVAVENGSYLEKRLQSEKKIAWQRYAFLKKCIEERLRRVGEWEKLMILDSEEKDQELINRLKPVTKDRPVCISPCDIRAFFNDFPSRPSMAWSRVLGEDKDIILVGLS